MMKRWITFLAFSNWWKYPWSKLGENKESNDAELRALQMKGKGKRKYRGYKRPKRGR